MLSMHTHEVVASSVTAHLAKLLARAFGVDVKTVEAWRRPKESDAFPWGTGKNSPLDQCERALRIIHPYDAAGARRWVSHLSEVIDQLEGARAAQGFRSDEHRCDLLAALVKEHSEAVIEMMRNRNDESALKELEEALAVGEQLAACLRAEIAATVQ